MEKGRGAWLLRRGRPCRRMQEPADAGRDGQVRLRPAAGGLPEAHPRLPLAEASRSGRRQGRVQGRAARVVPAANGAARPAIRLGRVRGDHRQGQQRGVRGTLSDRVLHPRREDRRGERRVRRQCNRMALRADRMQRARRALRYALSSRLAALLLFASLAGCQSPPFTPEQIAAFDYGPRPDNYETLVRDYIRSRVNDPTFALIEIKAGPAPLYQRD